jgi:hypothetical protein
MMFSIKSIMETRKWMIKYLRRSSEQIALLRANGMSTLALLYERQERKRRAGKGQGPSPNAIALSSGRRRRDKRRHSG